MVALGDAFFWGEDRKHLWVVISTPQGSRSEFVIVNFTTLDERTVDESCILHPDDYRDFITHPTAVFYVDAKLWWVAGANGYDAIAFSGRISRMPALDDRTLLRIQEGALKSDFFLPDFKPRIQQSLVVLRATSTIPPPRRSPPRRSSVSNQTRPANEADR